MFSFRPTSLQQDQHYPEIAYCCSCAGTIGDTFASEYGKKAFYAIWDCEGYACCCSAPHGAHAHDCIPCGIGNPDTYTNYNCINRVFLCKAEKTIYCSNIPGSYCCNADVHHSQNDVCCPARTVMWPVAASVAIPKCAVASVVGLFGCITGVAKSASSSSCKQSSEENKHQGPKQQLMS